MKNNVIKLIIGLFATGTLATAGIITTNKLMNSKEEENIMTKQVESTSIDENKTDNEIIENNTENITENATIESENKVEEEKNINTDKAKTSSKKTQEQSNIQENISTNKANNTAKTEVPEVFLPKGEGTASKGEKVEIAPMPINIDEPKSQNITSSNEN